MLAEVISSVSGLGIAPGENSIPISQRLLYHGKFTHAIIFLETFDDFLVVLLPLDPVFTEGVPAGKPGLLSPAFIFRQWDGFLAERP